MQRFLFATGIEGSYPVIAGRDGAGLRMDEMEKTALGPGRYDWEFADAFFAEVQRLHITPIVDLCHSGLPGWLGNFQNPEFARFFAEYAEAFELYTPGCIVGNDYYATNEHIVYPDGSAFVCEMFGYLHSETDNRDAGKGQKDARVWLEKQWSNLLRLKADGVPILGFTWYGLVDQVDWDSSRATDAGNVNRDGLCDLERRVSDDFICLR